MSLLRTASVAALAGLALAACSRSSDKPAAPASSAAGGKAGQTAPAPPAGGKDQLGPEIPASQMPVIRAGLWETVETSPSKPPRKDQNCESGKRQPLSMGSECQKLTLHRTVLGGYVIDSQCSYGDTSLGLHVEAHGDFQTHWTADFTSRVKLPGQAEQVDTSHKDARYLGACPKDMQSGD